MTRACRLTTDLLSDGLQAHEEDWSGQLLLKAHMLSVREEFKRLRQQGVISKEDEDTLPTAKIPDCIAISTASQCKFPCHSSIIVATDDQFRSMQNAVDRMGKPKANERRVGAVQFGGQKYSVRYNAREDVFEVPGAKGRGPGAFVISQSHKTNMSCKDIPISSFLPV